MENAMRAPNKNLLTVHDHLMVAPTMDGHNGLFGMAGPAAVFKPLTVPAPVARAATAMASAAKWIGLLFAAPLIGLLFVVAFPVIGLATLVWMARAGILQYSVKIARFGKNALLFLAAPLAGLAYVIAFPFVGLAVLGWMGAKALTNS
jgi:hypothetical protein